MARQKPVNPTDPETFAGGFFLHFVIGAGRRSTYVLRACLLPPVHAGLNLTAGMLVVRGVVRVTGTNLSVGMDTGHPSSS